MTDAAGSSRRYKVSCTHIPTFSARHPMIPKRYVMPWKQDMKHQRQLMKNAALAQIPVVPLEESLFLGGKERLCHAQDIHRSTSSSFSVLLSQTAALRSSHFSRYHSSVVTASGLEYGSHYD